MAIISRSNIVGILLGFVIYYSIFIYYHRIKPTNRVSVKDSQIPSKEHEIIAIQHLQQQNTQKKAPIEKIELVTPSLPQIKEILPQNEVSTALDEHLDASNKPLVVVNNIPDIVVPKPKPIQQESHINDCLELKNTYSVEIGLSWGTLPVEKQKLWTKYSCDKVKYDDVNTAHSDQEPIIKSNEVNEELTHPTGISTAKQTGLIKIPEEYVDWCIESKQKYKVLPMKSWGSLPTNMIEIWKNRRCDLVFTVKRMSRRSVSTCLTDTDKLKNHPNLNISLPLISVMAATTTRKVKNPSTETMALFIFLLPSLIRTLDCGYRYEYVLGFDKGDPFYDTTEGMDKVKKWFIENVEKPLRENAIIIKLRTVRVNNTIKKPGPVFIEMARAAYEAGSTYFYRINDDTELLSNWPNIFVHALNSLKFPYGVVGPICNQGNQKILTHDFVHRIHMEIFEMNYYPPQLTDWWMDDWISYVYGKKRTFKASKTQVIHHTGAHGQRYEVDRSHEALLQKLVVDGHNKIRKFMLSKVDNNMISEDDLTSFDTSDFSVGFLHSDVPQRIYDKYLITTNN